MDRREITTRALAVAAGAAVHGRYGLEAEILSEGQAPGAVAESEIKKARFPEGFLWGTATASYQVEGLGMKMERANRSGIDSRTRRGEYGRWGVTGDIACDQYHRYPQDIALAKQLNQKSYRFSISWPRIQPVGTKSGGGRSKDRPLH